MFPVKLGKDPFNQKHGGHTRFRMNSVHILVFATLIQQCCLQTFTSTNKCPDSKPGKRQKTFPGPWIIRVQLQTTRLDRTLDCLIKPSTLGKPSRTQQHHGVNFHLGFVPSGMQPPVDFTAVFPSFLVLDSPINKSNF